MTLPGVIAAARSGRSGDANAFQGLMEYWTDYDASESRLYSYQDLFPGNPRTNGLRSENASTYPLPSGTHLPPMKFAIGLTKSPLLPSDGRNYQLVC